MDAPQQRYDDQKAQRIAALAEPRSSDLADCPRSISFSLPRLSAALSKHGVSHVYVFIFTIVHLNEKRLPLLHAHKD